MDTKLEPNNDTMFANPWDSVENHDMDVHQNLLPIQSAQINNPLELYDNNFPR